MAGEAMSGFEAHKLLKVIHNKVKGDGSCWVYAVLACLGPRIVATVG